MIGRRDLDEPAVVAAGHEKGLKCPRVSRTTVCTSLEEHDREIGGIYGALGRECKRVPRGPGCRICRPGPAEERRELVVVRSGGGDVVPWTSQVRPRIGTEGAGRLISRPRRGSECRGCQPDHSHGLRRLGMADENDSVGICFEGRPDSASDADGAGYVGKRVGRPTGPVTALPPLAHHDYRASPRQGRRHLVEV